MQKKVDRSSDFWVIDISNSFTKFALSNPKKLLKVYRYPTPKISKAWIQKTFLSKKIPIVLGSVVPQKTALFQKIASPHLFLLNGKTAKGITIDYPKPAQIGADRIANAIAAQHLYGTPAIVIDFGTAVTFDVVTAEGAYAGGVIAPGLNAMTQYLHEKTALLPAIQIQKPKRAIGKSTKEAMLSGTVFGYRGLVKEILLHLKKELKGTPRVIATGGQALVVTQGLSEIKKVNPLLTLEGLRLFYSYLK
ncbi:MAG: type III pantothenate kinase [Verrucomicrobiota bacterium]